MTAHNYSINLTNNSIQITDDITYTHINIYSMAGALLVKEKLFNNRLDNLKLAPSFYIVEISGKNHIIREKILIR